jgi:hypothetical protein
MTANSFYPLRRVMFQRSAATKKVYVSTQFCSSKRVMGVFTLCANKSDGSTRLPTKKRDGVAHLIHQQE